MNRESIGRRMTSQRKLVMDIIGNTTRHLDAEEIYLKAKEKDKKISIATVYRNINLLKEIGLVAERHLGDEHHHYELNLVPQHYHLICIGCGEVYEFQSDFVEEMRDTVEKASKFDVTDIEIDLKGYCSKCKESVSE